MYIIMIYISCIVEFDGDKVAELKDRENCNNRFKGTKVCVENYESKKDGIFACNVKIDRMNDDLVGDWEVEVIGERSKKEKVDFELELLELPDEIKLRSGRNDLEDEDDEVEPERDGFKVTCSVEGGEPEPEIRLYAGGERVIAEEDDCRDGDQ